MHAQPSTRTAASVTREDIAANAAAADQEQTVDERSLRQVVFGRVTSTKFTGTSLHLRQKSTLLRVAGTVRPSERIRRQRHVIHHSFR